METKYSFIKIKSKGYGSVQSTDDLINLLETEPLDRRFEELGNFILAAGSKGHGYVSTPHRLEALARKEVIFFGNFLNVSHAFNIVTNSKPLILFIARYIRANQRRQDYINQPRP